MDSMLGWSLPGSSGWFKLAWALGYPSVPQRPLCHVPLPPRANEVATKHLNLSSTPMSTAPQVIQLRRATLIHLPRTTTSGMLCSSEDARLCLCSYFSCLPVLVCDARIEQDIRATTSTKCSSSIFLPRSLWAADRRTYRTSVWQFSRRSRPQYVHSRAS